MPYAPPPTPRALYRTATAVATLTLAALTLAAVCGSTATATAQADSCTLVVIGSSTAAGVGPSTPDSAWVNRYRAGLAAAGAPVRVVNLARGGYTTYQLLPDAATVDTAVHEVIDSARNIDAALAERPRAIVINLPSNDAAKGYPVAAQLANYDAILARAGEVPVYVATPQPRKLEPDGVAMQRVLLDSTYARFGVRAIDFWTGLALPDGLPDPAYDSGDGIHLNAAGHAILLSQVVAAGVEGACVVGAGGAGQNRQN